MLDVSSQRCAGGHGSGRFVGRFLGVVSYLGL